MTTLRRLFLFLGIVGVAVLIVYGWSLFPKARHEELTKESTRRGRDSYESLKQNSSSEANGLLLLEKQAYLQGPGLQQFLSVTSDLRTVEDYRARKLEKPEVYSEALDRFDSKRPIIEKALKSELFLIPITTLRLDLQKYDVKPLSSLQKALQVRALSYAAEDRFNDSIEMFELGFMLADKLRAHPILMPKMAGAEFLRRQSMAVLESSLLTARLSPAEFGRLVNMTEAYQFQPSSDLTTALEYELASVDQLYRSVRENGEPNLTNLAGSGLYFRLPGATEREFRIYRNIMGDTLSSLSEGWRELPKFFTEEADFWRGDVGIISAILVPNVNNARRDLYSARTLCYAVHLTSRLYQIQAVEGRFPKKFELDEDFQGEYRSLDSGALSSGWTGRWNCPLSN